MKICIIGTGYVGLVTGACLANLGNKVVCVDNNKERVAILMGGKIPFYEPGLLEIVLKNSKSNNLRFTTDLAHGVKGAELIFIAVGTPASKNGKPDISAIIEVGNALSIAIKSDKKKRRIIIIKSTAPVGTGKMVAKIFKDNAIPQNMFAIVSNPEFLREGVAVSDFMSPDRIVIGSVDRRACRALAKLYRPLNARIVYVSNKSAELIKYAANAFLATKISFINEIAGVCAKLGADINDISHGIGLDKRIGKDFLKAGLGYGGGCLPKDLAALIHLLKAHKCVPRMLQSVDAVNKSQINKFVSKIIAVLRNTKNKQIAILGVSFKPGTDDFRNAPSRIIIKRLIARGIKIRVYDPVIKKEIKLVIPSAVICKSVYEAVKGADALAIITEWPEFKTMELKKIKFLMNRPFIFDGRNILDPKKVRALGFTYTGIGR